MIAVTPQVAVAILAGTLAFGLLANGAVFHVLQGLRRAGR